MAAPQQKKGYAGRSLVIGCLGILVLGVLGVLAAGLFGAHGHTLTGTMTVHESVGTGSCTGTGGYTDIHAGSAVVVKDEGGKVLATGELGDGKVESGACVFLFSVSGVPDANFYQVEVSHRGEVTYSKADMEASGWNVAVQLGA